MSENHGECVMCAGADVVRQMSMSAAAANRPASPEAAARRSPTRLAKFSSAPGDYGRQQATLAKYDTPPVRSASAAPYAPSRGPRRDESLPRTRSSLPNGYAWNRCSIKSQLGANAI